MKTCSIILGALIAITAIGAMQERRSWYKLQWQGDNIAYEKIRDNLDKQAAANGKSSQWITNLKRDATNKPKDALAQFAYAYSNLLVANKYNDNGKMLEPLNRMLKIEPPYSREYIRLLFVIEFYYFQSRNLIPVGRRLLNEMPNDVEITWQLGVLLSQEPDLKSKREGLSLTAKAVKASPNHVGLRFTHAMRAYWVYEKTKSKEDAKFAISAFQDYLRIAPDTVSQRGFRNAAKAHVSGLTRVVKGIKAPRDGK